jgi:Tol biopolymer transport system component/DNA-binding winged helix-turn-helix (wHTH) protein
MTEPGRRPGRVRFDAFEVFSDGGELRKNGTRLKLSGQAIEVLLMLLETPGRLVPREDLQQKLWPGASFGDFDHGLNAAVNRLREVLGDSVTDPKFIETVPRRGYRFIGQIEPDPAAIPKPAVTAAARSNIPTRAWLLRRWNLLLAATGLLAPIIAGWYILLQHPKKQQQELRAVHFTTYTGFEAAPSFSPDGNQIAFCWYQEWGPPLAVDLYVKQIRNEHAIRLTYHKARLLIPAWSPDGKSIAFSMVGKDGNGIYVLPSLGGPERRLAEIRDTYLPFMLLSWSPDSRWLAFASDSATAKASSPPEHYRIHLFDMSTGEERILPDPSPDCLLTMEPAFSPDGRNLASVCVLSANVNKIYVQPLGGGRAHEVLRVNNSRALQGIAWTRDNRSILYGTDPNTTDHSLWRVPASGGTPEKLPFAHDAQMPAVAASGNKLAYAQVAFRPEIWRIDLGTPTRATGPAGKLISSSLSQHHPSISPDGKHIAFDSRRSGNPEIWVCDRDGSNPTQITSFGGPLTEHPRWSPDSRRIVFDSHPSGYGELYIVNADGGTVHRLTIMLNPSSPFWSADGQWIYFGTSEPDAIWKMPAEGGTAIRLTKDGTYDPQESVDGKRLFYVDGRRGGKRNQLWSVSVNGGDERLEPGMPPLRLGAAWASARDGIYFIDGYAPPHYVKYLDFATRRLYEISDLPTITLASGGIAVSRNNDTLLFTGIDHAESDIMLVEDFR